MSQLSLFFTALTFYTRLPGLRWADTDDAALSRATRFLPLVGLVVGVLSASVFFAATAVLPRAVAVILAMGTSVWVTGAFHEDGLADTCDGLGGGWSKADVLRIMKDSRLGTYGAVGLVLALLLKFALLTSLPVALLPAVLVGGHAVSRWPPIVGLWRLQYVRDDDASKIRPVARGVGFGQVAVAAVFALAPLALLPPLYLGALIPVLLAAIWLLRLCHRRLGGYTGDTLGAVQQVGELAFYLGVVCLWTYISSATPASP